MKYIGAHVSAFYHGLCALYQKPEAVECTQRQQSRSPRVAG